MRRRKALGSVILLGALLPYAMLGNAEPQQQARCGVRSADILKETTLKLQLLRQDYRVKNIRFNPSTNCFDMKWLDADKRKIHAIIDPYTGEILDVIEALNPAPTPQ